MCVVISLHSFVALLWFFFFGGVWSRLMHVYCIICFRVQFACLPPFVSSSLVVYFDLFLFPLSLVFVLSLSWLCTCSLLVWCAEIWWAVSLIMPMLRLCPVVLCFWSCYGTVVDAVHSFLIFCFGFRSYTFLLFSFVGYLYHLRFKPILHHPSSSFLLCSPFPLTSFPFDVALCCLLILFLLSARTAWVFRWSKIVRLAHIPPPCTSASSFRYNFFVLCDKSTIHSRKTNHQSYGRWLSLCPCPHMDIDVYLSFGTWFHWLLWLLLPFCYARW